MFGSKTYRTEDIYLAPVTIIDEQTRTNIYLKTIPFLRVLERNGLIDESKDGYTLIPLEKMNIYYFVEEYSPITDYLEINEIKPTISIDKINHIIRDINSGEKQKVKKMKDVA